VFFPFVFEGFFLHQKERGKNRTKTKGEKRSCRRCRLAARSSGRDRLALAGFAAGTSRTLRPVVAQSGLNGGAREMKAAGDEGPRRDASQPVGKAGV